MVWDESSQDGGFWWLKFHVWVLKYVQRSLYFTHILWKNIQTQCRGNNLKSQIWVLRGEKISKLNFLPLYLMKLIFKASALWADAFYKSNCPSVCVFVCLSVHFWGTVGNGLKSPHKKKVFFADFAGYNRLIPLICG